MADQPENPPPRIAEPPTERTIRRIEKRAAASPENRPRAATSRPKELPHWRRWLSTKMI